MTAGQIADCAARIANHIFGDQVSSLGGAAKATAGVNSTDLQNAVSAVDAGFDTTLTNATTATSGTTTVVQYLASTIPAPASGGTVQQKTILACYVLLKRAGLL